MKKFSDLINENNTEKTYSYEATVKVKGEVKAASEGDAGELVDKEMDSIAGLEDYTIDKIDEIVKEKIVLESEILNNNEDKLENLSFELTNNIEAQTNNLPNVDRVTVYEKIILNLQLKINQLNNIVV